MMSEQEKDLVKNKYSKTSIARYHAELYSRFTDENKVFNYESSLVVEEEIKKPLYDYVCCAYDYASTVDEPIVQVMGYDPNKKKLVSITEHKLPKGTPEIRAPHIQNILNHSKQFINNN
jgi:hypothetical protein